VDVNPSEADSPCPCGSGKPYPACCEPVLKGRRTAATAEEQMRARYTAHAVGDQVFLHRTYLPTSKLPFVEDPAPSPQVWTRLEVHSHEAGPRPDVATVDFSAHFTEGGSAGILHEKAEFIRTGGEWIYSRALRLGPAPVRSAHPKVGRNDPCPCGSGKKYKHCCLART
jgi:SEC-C motif-containing protein